MTLKDSWESGDLFTADDANSVADAINTIGSTVSAITTSKGQANGYASLDSSGHLPDSQLPPDAATTTYVTTAIGSFSSNKGQANGFASLDSTGKVPSSQLPAATVAGLSDASIIGKALLTAANAPTILTILSAKPASYVPSSTDVTNALGYTPENVAHKNAASGYAGLDSSSRISSAQLTADAMEFKGAWNAFTNSPAVANGTGSFADMYRVSVAGTQNLGAGSVYYSVGDLIFYDGSAWQQSVGSNAVSSVNGMTGAVTVTTISGNAGTATALQTPRALTTILSNIGPTNFDGSASVSIGVNGILGVGYGGTGATSLTGLVKGNGISAFTAATAGTDYVAPGGDLGTPSGGTLTNCVGLPIAGISATGIPSSATYLRGDGSWSAVSSPLVFNAHDYGVIADGAQHNNMANLIDCIAQCGAAGGGIVQLPEGTIVTSEAVRGATLTATSGNTYVNNGGIPIPVGAPIVIKGYGPGSTTLQLSPGMPRAFDFWYTADGQSYQDVVISDMTITRNGLTGATLASGTASGTVTIASGSTWQTIPGLTASAWVNASFAYHPTSMTLFVVRVSGGNVQFSPFVYSSGSSTTINSGDVLTGALYDDHVVIGNRYLSTGTANPYNMTWDRILVSNVVSIVPAPTLPTTPMQLSYRIPDSATHVWMMTLPRSGTLASSKCTNVDVKNCRFYGGANGVAFIGGGWYDDVWIEDCLHDTLVAVTSTTGNWAGTNFFFGDKAPVGRAGIIRSTGKNSGDPALEVDNVWDFTERDCKWLNCYSNFFSTTYSIPCRTSAGPSTCLLGTGGAMTNSSATITSATNFVNAMPADVDSAGLVKIDNELCWYVANGTTWTVYRAINGTTAAAHSIGATVTFIESHKQRYRSINSTFTNDAALCVSAYQFTSASSGIPSPRLDIRDATVTMVGGNLYQNKLILTQGWSNGIDIQGVSYRRSDFASNYSSGAVPGIIELQGSKAAINVAAGVPIPPTRVYGRDNVFVAHGTNVSANCILSALQPWDGYYRFDFDFAAEFLYAGSATQGVQAIYLNPWGGYGGTGSTLIIAKGSRFGFIGRNLPSGVTPMSPVGVYVGGTTYVTIQERLDLSLNLEDWQFTSNSTDGYYLPTKVDASQPANTVFITDISNSTSATLTHPSGYLFGGAP